MLFLFVVLMIMVILAALWPEVERIWRRRGPRRSAKPQRSGPEASHQPESLEGVLLVQLSAGDVTKRQYRQAMERLAARDDERHPLVVPPDSGPANA